MSPHRYQRAAGWLAVAAPTGISCLWAWWGIIEAFHEGWYHASIWENLALTLVQYLSPMLLFITAALVGIRWPRLGAALFVAVAVGVALFFRGAKSGVVLLGMVGPLLVLGLLYGWGRIGQRRWAVLLATALPLGTLIAFGSGPAIRVAGRFDDGDRGARLVSANGLRLLWAPEGPGWPLDGVSWEEARRRCRHLVADGTALAETAQDIWRLPTVAEVVGSQSRHGQNSGGVWDERSAMAHYRRVPDKEPPLWHPHSKIIYWWTATELDERRAYIVVYDGKVWPRPKNARLGYLGFRAVRSPDGLPSTQTKLRQAESAAPGHASGRGLEPAP